MAEQFKARRVACAAQGDCAESDWSDSFTTAGSPLLPHTDGYVYGDHLPDMIFLLSEHEAEQGGANFVVDGEAVLRQEGDFYGGWITSWISGGDRGFKGGPGTWGW